MKAAMFALIASSLLLAGCEREARRFGVEAKNQTPAETADRMSTNQPALAQQGKVRSALRNDSPYDENAYAVNQGKRLYRWYNCNGCHSMGGGGIGPALMDDVWVYGSEPRNIYATIVEGRPNGMPSFRNKITEGQLWQLVAYVRSLSGLVPAAARPARDDHMHTTPPSSLQDTQPPHPGGNTPAAAQAPQ